MVRDKREIEIDFSMAIKQAQELEDIAVELARMAREDVDETLLTLKSSFTGDNGDYLNRKTDGIRVNMLDAADDLLKVSRNIRQTADIVYKAEKAANSIFG